MSDAPVPMATVLEQRTPAPVVTDTPPLRRGALDTMDTRPLVLFAMRPS